ncbi:MAG: biopolymer transporter Tol [Verrucomicrobiota bacterium]
MKLSFWILLLVGFATSLTFAQTEKPVVLVDKKARFDIYVAPITGPNGEKATHVLENDLKMSGSFNMTAPAAAAFTANAQLTESGLSGSVTPKNQGSLFNKNFEGDWRRATHLYADAIIEAITGTQGFASSKITFVSAHTGSKEVYVSDMDGGNGRQLTNDKTISLGPKWSPNAKQIAYTSYRSNFPDVWVIDLVSSKRKRVAYFPGLNGQPCFSPDGEKIALTLSKDGNTELYVMNADGTSPMRLTNTRGTEASPTWSPDGKQIAYVSDNRGSAQIFTIPSNGGAPNRIKTNSSYATEPDWSPDGKKLAYSIMVGGQLQIAITDLATSEQIILTDTSHNESPTWTRNSRHLVYTRNGHFYLLDSLTKQSLQINNGLTRNSEPNCSK